VYFHTYIRQYLFCELINESLFGVSVHSYYNVLLVITVPKILLFLPGNSVPAQKSTY